MYYNFTKFHQNWMKNIKVLLIARFSVQNIKVSVELRKLYIVVVYQLLMNFDFFRYFSVEVNFTYSPFNGSIKVLLRGR